MPTVHGIDVSHYQTIDWAKVPQLQFVAVKATQGTQNKDPKFSANWAAMRHRGFECRVAYHFLDNSNPAAQARFFQSIVGQLQQGETLALDFEQKGVTANEAVAFLNALEMPAGHTPLFYAGEYFGGSHDPRLQGYPVWMPQYRPAMVSSRHVVVWQFSSSGQVPGIAPARVDVNEIHDMARLRTACGYSTAPAPPTTDLAALRRAFAADLQPKCLALPVPLDNRNPPSDDIRTLQWCINTALPTANIPITGTYDTPTAFCVLAFQKTMTGLNGGHDATPDAFPGQFSNQTRWLMATTLGHVAAGQA